MPLHRSNSFRQSIPLKIVSQCVAGLWAASLLALGPAAVAQERTLVVSAFGVSQDLLRKDLYAPFEAKCKCKVVVNVGNSTDRLAKMEARKANPEVDVAVLADFSALEAAAKDLIEPIDVARLKNYSKLHAMAQNPIGNHMGVGYTYFATSIIYRSDKVKIESWKDLWKPELKGRLALPNITTTQGPTMLMMVDKAWGGTTPDFATGIQKVSEIKGGVVTFYERAAQVVQLFQQDEVHAAVVGRLLAADQEAEHADCLGDTEGRANGRCQRAGDRQKRQEQGPGLRLHRRVVVDRGADQAGDGPGRQPRQQGGEAAA